MQKKGEVLKQWRRRFISLTSDRRLHYFRDESSANTTEPLGSIDIASALSYVTCLFIHLILIGCFGYLGRIEEAEEHRPNCFAIKTVGRVWLLVADTKKEAVNWRMLFG